MSDVAVLIADLIAADVSPELVGRVALALSRREVVIVGDEQAERRRERDRVRKQGVRGIPQKSAECADTEVEPPIEKKNTNQKKIGPAKPASAEKRASRLAAEWALPADWRAWAVEQGCPDPDFQAARFGDHYRGTGKRQVDWEATWRNWVRKAPDFAPTKAARQQSRDSPPAAEPVPNAYLSELRSKAATLKTGSQFARDAAQRYARHDLHEMVRLQLLTVSDLQKIGVTLQPRAVG